MVISRNYVLLVTAAFPFGVPFSAFFVLPLLRGHVGHYLVLLHPRGRLALAAKRYTLLDF